MLVVDLKVRDLHVVTRVGARLMRDPVEQFLARARDQARIVGRAHHGVTLARPRLAIREDARVVALEVVVQEVFAKGAVDVLLVGVVRVSLIVRPVRAVKCELLVVVHAALVRGAVIVGGRKEGRLLGRGIHADEALGALFLLCACQYTVAWSHCGHIPRRTKALQRTTTLTLPGSSATSGAGAIIVKGSDARIEGAEAVVCSAEYMCAAKNPSSCL
jgi:hypothetical protein